MPPRLVATGLLALALAGCGGSDPAAEPTTTVAPPSSTTSTAAPEPAIGDVLADGRHPGYLRAADAGKRTVTVDVIQFLTGDEARKASAADHPGETLDSDYYIRNTNPKLRTLSLAAEVDVTLLDSELGGTDAAKSVPADVAALARVVAHHVAAGSTDANPYWLTLSGGKVTKVEQQYLP